MATGNGDDPTTTRMVDLLGQLVRLTTETRDELKGISSKLEDLRSDLNTFKDETRGELTDIRGELREIHEELTGIHREVGRADDRFEALRLDMQRHDGRLEALETAVFKKTGS